MTLPKLVNETAATTPEQNVAMALEQLGWSFRFQYPLFGGRRTIGGQVIDFLVFTTPLPTPLFVDSYWHGSINRKERDKLKRAQLANMSKGRYRPYVVVFEREVDTIERAVSTIRKLFGKRN
jgi:hypothetical protein